MKENLTIWNSVEKTDPAFTKNFKKGGGFSGTAINAVWLAKRATETFGPIGLGWGVKVLKEQILAGAGEEKVHSVHIELWYMQGDKRGSVEHYGQTMFVGKNKNGLYTDEDAPKKSLTDATTKALSLLGFASDIHMGFYDDNKYVEEVDREFALKDKLERDEKIAAAKAIEKAQSGKAKSGDNVVPMKPVTQTQNQTVPVGEAQDGETVQQSDPIAESSEVVADEDGVIHQDDTPVVEAPTQSLADRIKARVDAIDDVDAVTELMTHSATLAALKEMPAAEAKALRSYAAARLKALGWPGNRKASS